ncbi:hypothetical protein OZX67_01285 [Bifidobacterium sp. ESL0728]|uniref:hypothetical protein n=1 Tax=Bifidobacterium sp. ESL0728 TaxID=2983220 RepID=UPI0023F6E97F|nr:hypothetical protein [Bifidobacterium sp. ESL0728]WEV59235.1 hypothetical protein OZX67_01285 [Bifidobacterium sp. ESL0728]
MSVLPEMCPSVAPFQMPVGAVHVLSCGSTVGCCDCDSVCGCFSSSLDCAGTLFRFNTDFVLLFFGFVLLGAGLWVGLLVSEVSVSEVFGVSTGAGSVLGFWVFDVFGFSAG